MGYHEIGRKFLYLLFDPLVKMFYKLGVKPNHITILGLLLNGVAVFFLLNKGHLDNLRYSHGWILFGFIIGFAGSMDSIDGRLARLYNQQTLFGAYFDSVIDRYSEFVMMFGLVIYFMHFNKMVGVIAVLLAIMGSIMVSYNRSRAESLGVDCSVGLMQRPERIVFIGLWSIFCGTWATMAANSFMRIGFAGQDLYILGMVFLAISTNITALRRIVFTHQRFLELKK